MRKVRAECLLPGGEGEGQVRLVVVSDHDGLGGWCFSTFTYSYIQGWGFGLMILIHRYLVKAHPEDNTEPRREQASTPLCPLRTGQGLAYGSHTPVLVKAIWLCWLKLKIQQ